jgi:hypothetical protein
MRDGGGLSPHRRSIGVRLHRTFCSFNAKTQVRFVLLSPLLRFA